MAAPDLKGKYTYKDYLTWDDGKRWEIIEGKVYPLEFGDDPKNMSPAPGRRHQEISAKLIRIIGNFLVGKTCKVIGAPFDVRFIENDLSETVLQPDISVFCDSTKLNEKGAIGAPDWIIEIISPSTEFRDKTVKAFLYQKHGVRSYWLIDPSNESLATFQLMPDGRFDVPLEYKEGSVPTIFDDFSISFEEIFLS
ncbi:MAG: Uma2 family endonuclease [Cyclobacteriaceae bacterium]